MQIEDCRLARQVAEWNPQGRRRGGRPVNAWKEGTEESLQRRNFNDDECFDGCSGAGGICLWVEENCVFTEKFIIYCIYILI
jgi:hypothetical protein